MGSRRFACSVLGGLSALVGACSGPAAPAQVSSAPPPTASVAPAPLAPALPEPKADMPDVTVPAATAKGPPLERVLWSPRGRWLGFTWTPGEASESAPMSLHLLDLASGVAARSLTMFDHGTRPSYGVDFSPDDAFVATSIVGEGIGRVFRLSDGSLVKQIQPGVVYGVTFSPDSSRALFASVFGESTLLGLPRGEVVRQHRPRSNGASFAIVTEWSPRSDRFVLRGGGVELRDGRTGAKIAELPGSLGADTTVYGFSADGKELFAGTEEGLVKRMRLVPFAVLDDVRAATPGTDHVEIHGPVAYVSIPAGIEVLELATKASRLLKGSAGTGGPMFFSPSGALLARRSVANDGTAPGGAAAPVTRVLSLLGDEPPASVAGVPVGFSAGNDLWLTQGDDLVVWSPGEKKVVYRARFEAGCREIFLSEDRRFAVCHDEQLVFVRARDRALLRVQISPGDGGPRVSPAAPEIAAFFQ